VFQLVRAIFEQFGAGPVTWGGLTAPRAVRCVVASITTWCGQSNRPGQSEQVFALCCIAALVQGECALAQGELAYVQGELLVVFELWIGGLVCTLCLSMVLSRTCRVVALA
jgi:hypothetical protein